MKRKELIAAVLVAAMLTGCASGASNEPAGSESSQETTIETSGEGAEESVGEASIEADEASQDESVAEASVEEIKVERPEKANSEYPFLFININWEASSHPSVQQLGFTEGESSNVSSVLSSGKGDMVLYTDCKGEEDFSRVSLMYSDNGLTYVSLDDDNGADRLDRYKELFVNYYGEPDVKTDDNTAFMWYTDECIAMLDAFPNFENDPRLEISYLPAAKDASDKEKAQMIFDAQHGTIKIEFTTE
ncbi:MAG: hypothetical protein J5802_10615 [Butyrivibrio sp.]|nr:hypothetical protein [Butyrivibrio sp.]